MIHADRLVALRSRTWNAVVGCFDAHPTGFVFVIALALRLACIVWLNGVQYEDGGDAPRYLSIAGDILSGRGYGTTFGDTTRVPLFQVFLAAHLWAFGDMLVSIAITQALLGAATAVMMTRTAEELIPGPHRWIVGLLWATYPPAIVNTVVIFPQPLQVFWLTGAFWFLVTGVSRSSTAWCGAAAILWGMACLTRAGNLFFLPVFAAAPVLCWRFGPDVSIRWALKASLAMFLCGAASVLWWTARDFPTTYRLQDLLLNPKERRAVVLLLSPFQPLPELLAAQLRAWSGADTGDLPSPETVGSVNVTIRNWTRELHRVRTKLWQTFGAPAGCVHLRCTGPPAGYWATFRAEVARQPGRVLALAFGRPCLALKSVMYFEHYLLLILVVPGFMLLARHAPGMTVLLLLYLGYTVVIIVLGSNYSSTIAAVPRYAWSITPVPLLVVGLIVSRMLLDVRDVHAGGAGEMLLGAVSYGAPVISRNRNHA
jgi:4-amino-4-deoxy-L-arabinose transferase-like glycosyltransferase